MRVSPRKPLRVRGAHRRPFGVACALLLACGALASSATAAGTVDADGSEAVLGSSASSGSAPGGPVLPSTGGPSATLEQCVTSGVQAERSATFLGEMTATPGTGRMSMRIELQERPAERGRVPQRRSARPRRLARRGAGGQDLPLPQAGHQPRRAGRLPRRRPLPLAEREGQADQGASNGARPRACSPPAHRPRQRPRPPAPDRG